jgi:predicted nucleotidyltransferase
MALREVIEMLKRYLSVLRSEGIVIEKAFLYGSYLHGAATPDSDIDILIVTENETDNLTGKAWSLTRRVNSKIEPYLVGKARFYGDENSPLIDWVKRSGLEIS